MSAYAIRDKDLKCMQNAQLAHAIRYIPFIAADMALQWAIRAEKQWVQLVLYRKNCCAVTSLVAAFLGHLDDIPIVPGDAYVRLASKLIRMEFSTVSFRRLVKRMKQRASFRSTLRFDLAHLTAKDTNWDQVTVWC